MIETILFSLIGLALLASVMALLRQPPAFRPRDTPASRINIDEFAAVHCRYFPQVRQALSPADEAYLSGRAASGVLQEWRVARRRVMREFLTGLYDDFARLNQMARAVSRLAPQLDSLHEAQLFWLGLRFQLVYRLALLELNLGKRPVDAFLRLAAMIGGLGSTLERAASALSEDSAMGRPSVLTS